MDKKIEPKTEMNRREDEDTKNNKNASQPLVTTPKPASSLFDDDNDDDDLFSKLEKTSILDKKNAKVNKIEDKETKNVSFTAQNLGQTPKPSGSLFDDDNDDDDLFSKQTNKQKLNEKKPEINEIDKSAKNLIPTPKPPTGLFGDINEDDDDLFSKPVEKISKDENLIGKSDALKPESELIKPKSVAKNVLFDPLALKSSGLFKKLAQNNESEQDSEIDEKSSKPEVKKVEEPGTENFFADLATDTNEKKESNNQDSIDPFNSIIASTTPIINTAQKEMQNFLDKLKHHQKFFVTSSRITPYSHIKYTYSAVYQTNCLTRKNTHYLIFSFFIKKNDIIFFTFFGLIFLNADLDPKVLKIFLPPSKILAFLDLYLGILQFEIINHELDRIRAISSKKRPPTKQRKLTLENQHTVDSTKSSLSNQLKKTIDNQNSEAIQAEYVPVSAATSDGIFDASKVEENLVKPAIKQSNLFDNLNEDDDDIFKVDLAFKNKPKNEPKSQPKKKDTKTTSKSLFDNLDDDIFNVDLKVNEEKKSVKNKPDSSGTSKSTGKQEEAKKNIFDDLDDYEDIFADILNYFLSLSPLHDILRCTVLNIKFHIKQIMLLKCNQPKIWQLFFDKYPCIIY
ncbi:hypothetical protein BpHYR1_013901 [Brachionus plicatilis]|uniref:Uncharacterized protein n=1 Tax=Brachionus plicatilis TaxID=10195 RepID=A0A3M7R173_BRAPC|nr:hypothetical protein BpHYR1_013901 [Brachionus plicatilis]